MQHAIDDFYRLLSVGSWEKNDWDQVVPDAVQSYVCAMFAELAYYHVPEWEIDDRKRAKLIPCAAYRSALTEMIGTLQVPVIDGPGFVADTRGVAVIGKLFNRTLFIAFRGTQFLFDWSTNVRWHLAQPQNPWWYDRFGCGQFHAGFLEEAIRISAKILYEIRDYEFDHVFLTGHSLGGAVAAISDKLLSHHIGISTVHILGAPKYCDVSAYATTPLHQIPTQFRRPGDMVPTVPIAWQYSEHPYTFGTDCKPYRDEIRDATSATRALKGLAQWMQFWTSHYEAHDIERYRTEIGRAAGVPGAELALAPMKKLTTADVGMR